MKAKRNNVKLNFANTIMAQTSTQKNYSQKRLLDYSSIIEQNLNSSYVHSKESKKSKQVEDYYRMLNDKMEQYQIYYMFLMENQAKKYDQYYQQIFKIIFDQFQLGKIYIQKQIQRVHQTFENKKEQLKQLMSDLCLYGSKDIKLEEKMQRLTAHQLFQIDIVSVNLIDLANFKHDIKKYLMRQFDINCSTNSMQKDRNHSNQNSAQFDHTIYPSFNKNKQQCSTQTCPEEEAIPTNQMTENKSQESQDDLLNCDEELGQKMSESTRRRRKYQVGRQNVIKEEDESDQSNSIIQNYIQ